MSPTTETPKVFLIEDDAELCRGWADVFDLLGYEFRCHHKGLDALQDVEGLMQSNILITDYYLPDINGAELVQKVKSIQPRIHTIVLTGSREPTVVEAVKKVGQTTLLHKPINIDDLEAEILKLLKIAA